MIQREDLFYIMWGNYILSTPTENEEECLARLDTHLWQVLTAFVLAVSHADKTSGILNEMPTTGNE